MFSRVHLPPLENNTCWKKKHIEGVPARMEHTSTVDSPVQNKSNTRNILCWNVSELLDVEVNNCNIITAVYYYVLFHLMRQTVVVSWNTFTLPNVMLL